MKDIDEKIISMASYPVWIVKRDTQELFNIQPKVWCIFNGSVDKRGILYSTSYYSYTNTKNFAKDPISLNVHSVKSPVMEHLLLFHEKLT